MPCILRAIRKTNKMNHETINIPCLRHGRNPQTREPQSITFEAKPSTSLISRGLVRELLQSSLLAINTLTQGAALGFKFANAFGFGYSPRNRQYHGLNREGRIERPSSPANKYASSASD